MKEVRHGKNTLLEQKADDLLAPVAPALRDIHFAIGEAIESQRGWRIATQHAFQKMAKAGRLLSAQKAVLYHGEWGPWLIAHIPDHYVLGRKGEEFKASCEAWQRTARNWIRIADILDHCHPSVIESAQTVAQLFRLAQFLPEGLPAPGTADVPPDPAEVVSRIKRFISSNADVLDAERVRSYPPEVKTHLRELIAPIWKELTAA